MSVARARLPSTSPAHSAGTQSGLGTPLADVTVARMAVSGPSRQRVRLQPGGGQQRASVATPRRGASPPRWTRQPPRGGDVGSDCGKLLKRDIRSPCGKPACSSIPWRRNLDQIRPHGPRATGPRSYPARIAVAGSLSDDSQVRGGSHVGTNTDPGANLGPGHALTRTWVMASSILGTTSRWNRQPVRNGTTGSGRAAQRLSHPDPCAAR